jgi:hypothetical protein
MKKIGPEMNRRKDLLEHQTNFQAIAMNPQYYENIPNSLATPVFLSDMIYSGIENGLKKEHDYKRIYPYIKKELIKKVEEEMDKIKKSFLENYENSGH